MKQPSEKQSPAVESSAPEQEKKPSSPVSTPKEQPPVANPSAPAQAVTTTVEDRMKTFSWPLTQAAHDELYAAATNGNARTQFLLARVYDIWGWGGWVRTQEDRDVAWTSWLRYIDFKTNETPVAVSRAVPDAEMYQRLAIEMYRAAAANGVKSAEEALRKHGVSK